VRSKKGYIYIISNCNFPNYYKIGVTEDIKSRLRTYQTSSPLRNYKIEYFIEHPDCYKAEKDIHENLKYFVLSRKKEWFEINNLQILIDRLDESLQPKEKICIDLYKK
jgi:predicted GIY-YIG superfamily endonuclease